MFVIFLWTFSLSLAVNRSLGLIYIKHLYWWSRRGTLISFMIVWIIPLDFLFVIVYRVYYKDLFWLLDLLSVIWMAHITFTRLQISGLCSSSVSVKVCSQNFAYHRYSDQYIFLYQRIEFWCKLVCHPFGPISIQEWKVSMYSYLQNKISVQTTATGKIFLIREQTLKQFLNLWYYYESGSILQSAQKILNCSRQDLTVR